MTISFVGSASAEATSLTLPTHQAGDLLVMLAARFATSAFATAPAGWSICGYRTDGNLPARSGILAWKVATSGSETSGTWTDANMLMCAVYRDATTGHTLGGHINSVTRNATSIQYGTLSALTTNNTYTKMQNVSAVVLGAIALNENTGVGSAAPAGMTNRATFAGASTGYMAIHDTGSAVSSFNATVTAASNINSVQFAAEIMNTGIVLASGGGFRAVNIRGGADQ